MTEEHAGYGQYLEDLAAGLAEAARASQAAIAQAEAEIAQVETEAEIEARQGLSPLERYTDARQELCAFECLHGELLSAHNELKMRAMVAEDALKAHARTVGNHENDDFRVIVQERRSRTYDGNLLLERAPWLEGAGVCTPVHRVEVDGKKLETLVKKEMLSPDVLDGVVTETPLTSAVIIRLKFGR